MNRVHIATEILQILNSEQQACVSWSKFGWWHWQMKMCWPAIGNRFKGLSLMPPVEAFVTWIKIFDQQKSVFDCLIVSFEAFDGLTTKTKMQLSFLHNRLFTQWYGTGFWMELWSNFSGHTILSWVVRVYIHKSEGDLKTRLPDNKVILCYICSAILYCRQWNWYGWSDHLAQLGYAHLVCVLVSRQNYGRPAVVASYPGHSQIISRSCGEK